MRHQIDARDLAILRALQENGRLSQIDLAQRIPLSSTAIARRVRAMESAGIICGYQACVDRRALGYELSVLVFVSLRNQSVNDLEAFERAARAAPSVIGCQLMSGDDDYILTVLARDLSDYENIHREQLSKLPGVTRLRSSFVLRDVKKTKSAPASA